MKKMTTLAVVAALTLAVGTTAFATELTEKSKPEMQGQKQGQMQEREMSEEKLAELEALAEEAGMTLEEYMESTKGNRADMGEKMGQREEMTDEMKAEMKAEMEAKKAEMEEKMAERQAEMEALADEAGLTIEEYMETVKPTQGEKPDGERLNGEKMDGERPEVSDEMKAEMEAKMAERQAEMEALAEEAGMTLEEYLASIKGAQGERGGQMQGGQGGRQ